MRKAFIVAAAIVAAALVPAPALAWGTDAHRYIMSRAIDLLPAELKPLFEHYRAELVVRTVDPDTWRLMGWEDDPNHFVNFGLKELGAFPFAALPRDYDAALQKFGADTLKRVGHLPWREAEMFGNMRRAFEGFATGAPYAGSNVVLFAAAAAHYIQDAHQPLHASNNYDGQLTGNDGIHARFERDLFERFESRLTINPPRPVPITNPRDTAFDVLLASYRLVDAILAADNEAVAGKDEYNDAYFEAFFARVRPVLERRLGDSISATAGLIVGAWELSGKPAPTLTPARPVQKVKKRP
jgi:hypothetical protein